MDAMVRSSAKIWAWFNNSQSHREAKQSSRSVAVGPFECDDDSRMRNKDPRAFSLPNLNHCPSLSLLSFYQWEHLICDVRPIIATLLIVNKKSAAPKIGQLCFSPFYWRFVSVLEPHEEALTTNAFLRTLVLRCTSRKKFVKKKRRGKESIPKFSFWRTRLALAWLAECSKDDSCGGFQDILAIISCLTNSLRELPCPVELLRNILCSE